MASTPLARIRPGPNILVITKNQINDDDCCQYSILMMAEETNELDIAGIAIGWIT